MKQVIHKPAGEFIFTQEVRKDKFYVVIHNQQIGFITYDYGKFIVKYIDRFITNHEVSPLSTLHFSDTTLMCLISGILNHDGRVYEFDTVKEMFDFITKAI